MKELESARIPCGEVYTTQETIDDPHIQEAGFLQSVPFPGKRVIVSSSPCGRAAGSFLLDLALGKRGKWV
jgi:crotonobetainyl-CoA:carnitine CoA-transferase CaiB-like acyl-CoA transferase